MVVADAGLPGLTFSYTGQDCVIHDDGRVSAAAGVVWDDLVAKVVAQDLAGVECMSGIPGWVGAAPVQNVGAYGQEIADTLVSVQALDRMTGELHELPADELGLAYRSSRFKHQDAGRFIVTRVDLQLEPGGAPTLKYPELVRQAGDAPTLSGVRETVRRIRKSKSMLLSDDDPNRRSAGSFFTNPIVPEAQAKAIDGPKYPAGANTMKLSAAWLIQNAGFGKGWGEGAAGLSTNHCHAIVNRGGARAKDILRVAAKVRAGVKKAFGITLVPEPVFLGFRQDVDSLLTAHE